MSSAIKKNRAAEGDKERVACPGCATLDRAGRKGILRCLGIQLTRGGRGWSIKKISRTWGRRGCFLGTVDQTTWGFECLIKEYGLLREWEAINSSVYCLLLFISRGLLWRELYLGMEYCSTGTLWEELE